MKILIFSNFSNIVYKNINIININKKNINYSIMKNHISYIGELSKINFIVNNKIININFVDAYFIQKKDIFKIICNVYSFI
ncbi:hypothetical protein ACJEC8_00075 [Candidatus Carsonella ruddii]|uniref:hypothetical protein n=1 Tax=Carsonella ruddii TaxID=114186 RepID=UPI003D41CA0E